jgi:type VI secretion system protein ImpJ
LERDQLDGFACLGVVRVVEGRADKSLILDEGYIPPCLDCRASPRLLGFINEIQGLLHHRGEYLASRLTRPGQSGVSEVADFLLLVAVNRWEPLAAHLAGMGGLHPERLYRELVQMAGDLCSYTRPDRRPPAFPAYIQDDLRASFEPVILELREALSKVIVERAIAIELQDRKYGFRVALVNDRTLFATAGFVLAAKANLAPEVLHSRFPSQVKLGPVEQIQQFVKLALPGIGLRTLPVAPRQIPYHAGFNYFELETRGNELWKQLESSGGLALHIAGEFPGLELEFWAVRG